MAIQGYKKELYIVNEYLCCTIEWNGKINRETGKQQLVACVIHSHKTKQEFNGS